MSINFEQITKRYQGAPVVNDASLQIEAGEFFVLLGPSGSGKSTLLRIAAGLTDVDHGRISFHGRDVTHLRARERGVGLVFQHYALFRHMTVFENVAFGLRVRPRRERPSEAVIRDKVYSLLKLVQLDWLAQRYPSQLSGGQRQRIALARALAVEPKMLLLDEPFGALDAKVRKDLRRWLRRLHDEMHITSVFVTHDQEEALEVADRVVVLNKGCIEQVGTPDEVYQSPATPFVYEFLGNVNLFHSRVQDGWAEIGSARIATPELAGQEAPAVAYVRPHDIELARIASEGALAAEVTEVRAIGPLVRIELKHGEERVEVELSRERYQESLFVLGEVVWFRPRHLKVFIKPEQPAPADSYAI